MRTTKTGNAIVGLLLAGILALMLLLWGQAARAAVSQEQLAAMNANLAAMNALMESLTTTRTGPVGRMGRMASDYTGPELPSPITGWWTTNETDEVQSTNPLPLSYTPVNLGPTDPPVLQFTYNDPSGLSQVALNCATGEVCELQGTWDLTLQAQPWVHVMYLENGQAYTFWATNPAVGMAYFRAVVVPDRWYVQYLNDPDNNPPVTSFIFPEEAMESGNNFFANFTNFSASVAVFTNWFLCPCYNTNNLSYPSAWQCAVITHYYIGSDELPHVDTTPVYMPANSAAVTFEINYVVNMGDDDSPYEPDLCECFCGLGFFPAITAASTPPCGYPPYVPCSPPPTVNIPGGIGFSGTGIYSAPTIPISPLGGDPSQTPGPGTLGQDPSAPPPDTSANGPARILSPMDDDYQLQCPSGTTMPIQLIIKIPIHTILDGHPPAWNGY